jgi:hypothetical protein
VKAVGDGLQSALVGDFDSEGEAEAFAETMRRVDAAACHGAVADGE